MTFNCTVRIGLAAIVVVVLIYFLENGQKNETFDPWITLSAGEVIHALKAKEPPLRFATKKTRSEELGR